MSELVAFGHQLGVTYTIHWIIMDQNACHKCQTLSTRTFNQNNLEGSWLVDSEYGPVWDLASEASMIHPNCRCILDIEMDIDEELFEVEDVGTIAEMKQHIADLKEEMSSLTMTYHEARELETILQRALQTMKKATGSEDVQKAIDAVQKFITVVRTAQYTWLAFEAATGPIGWAFALSGLAMTALTANEIAQPSW